MSQAETKGTTKRTGTTQIIEAHALTIGERMDIIRDATAEAHAARIAEARRAFETRIVDLVQSRVAHVIDGIIGE